MIRVVERWTMSATTVKMEAPPVELGNAPLNVDVCHGGTKLGRLSVSRGSVLWTARGHRHGRRLPWAKVARIFQTMGVDERELAPDGD